MTCASDPTGFLYVDKPAGRSSHDLVEIVRRAARTRRVGHAGTLDPFATGLLVIAVGTATRLLRFIDGEPKVYEATLSFGTETDTDDSTGEVVRMGDLPDLEVLIQAGHPLRLSAEASLTGHILQQPPRYSAKQVDGIRAYAAARRGHDLVLDPVRVFVHGWEWTGGSETTLDVRITCAGGTYVRALARDLGRALGSAAHCSALRRISSGPVSVRDAVACGRLVPGCIAEGRVSLQSPLDLLPSLSQQTIDADGLRSVGFGRPVAATVPGERAVLLHNGLVAAVGVRTAENFWQPRVVLTEAGQRPCPP